MSEKIGFDFVMVMLAIIDVIGVFLQSIASNFILLSIGYLIMPSSMFMITWSYSSWILPYRYSVRYISVLYGIYMFLLVVGPIFAGIISAFAGGYRSVFYANLILLVLQLIYTFKFIYDTQEVLQWRQSELMASYPDDHEQFPVLIIKHNKAYHDRGNRQFWDSFMNLNKFDRLILFLITISNRFLWSFEIVVLTYYVPYILQRYPQGNVINATAQLSVLGCGLGIGNVLVPKILLQGVKNVLYAKGCMMLISGMIEIILTGYFIPNNELFEMIWVYVFILGLCVGLHTMSLETIILEIQPKDSVAKMAAIKSVIINILKAFNLLTIGLLTEYYSIQWFWFIVAIIFSISFIASIIAVIVRKLQYVY